MSIQTESGEDLFFRLLTQNQSNTIESLNSQFGLDNRIFPNSIKKQDIIELNGSENSGKTELLMHLLSRCLLPSKWKIETEDKQEVCLDLSEYSALRDTQKCILIDTELKFNVLRFYTIIERRIKTKLNSTGIKIESNKLKNFIKELMQNLTVYKCNSSEQYLMTLAACERFIKVEQRTNGNKQIPVFIDSINSNYEFTDRLLHNDVDYTEKFMITILNRIISKLNVIIIATKCDYKIENSYLKWKNMVTHKLELENEGNKFKVTALNINDNRSLIISFEIDNKFGVVIN
jgi:hypothetical protein